MMTFGSLFAGIGGFDLGFHRAGMACSWQVEIDPAARSVLARHWSDVPKYADVRDCGAGNLASVDVLCGGFPCQDLSVAGRREGLAGERSGLFYEMTRIANELRPAFLVWENVPGLLSSRDGWDFYAVLTELDRIGYCGAWTCLDAQFFGVAQRRQRIFGVFARRDIGAARCAEVLALAARLPWNTQKGRAPRQSVAASITRSAGHHGRSSPRGDGNDNLVWQRRGGFGWSEGHGIAPTLQAEGGTHQGGSERVPMVGFSTSGQGWWRGGIGPGAARSHKDAENGVVVCGALSAAQGGPDDNSAQAGHVVTASRQVTQALTTTYGKQPDSSDTNLGPSLAISGAFGVRRLTPRECERLQGFPDDWTTEQSDSTRYRQLGNAVAVPVAEWIGRRIMEASR